MGWEGFVEEAQGELELKGGGREEGGRGRREEGGRGRGGGEEEGEEGGRGVISATIFLHIYIMYIQGHWSLQKGKKGGGRKH